MISVSGESDQSASSFGESDQSAYNAKSIETLEGLEAVRRNPGMYIGGTGSEGLMHLVWELLDNAVDEAAGGWAKNIDVVFHRDGSVEVADDGRGIPVGVHPTMGVSALEVVFTELHAGGKFNQSSYATSGGLHGVGASVVNAMSKKLNVDVLRHGYRHSLSFQNTQPGQFAKGVFTPGHNLKKKKLRSYSSASTPTGARSTPTGTRVRFWPDHKLFNPDAAIDAGSVKERLLLVAFLVSGLQVTLTDKRAAVRSSASSGSAASVAGETTAAHGSAGSDAGKTAGTAAQLSFVSEGGLADLVDEKVRERAGSSKLKQPVCSVITLKGMETFTDQAVVEGGVVNVERECSVDVALCWVNNVKGEVLSFVNTIPTISGGTHVAGFDKALTRVVNNVVLKENRQLAKLVRTNQHRAVKDDVQQGLIAAVQVKFARPQFQGQTKHALGTQAVMGIVSRATYSHLKKWFEPGGGPRSQVKAITDKLATAVADRAAFRQKLETDRKTSRLGSARLPGKLADCRVHGHGAELLLVEGDSAAGPAKQGRDSEFMAVLPLRGKIVNAAKASTSQVLDNAEAKAIFASVGAGAGPTFDIKAARYGRIVILCDADVDGSHIRCLLLTLIYRYMRDMLAHGRVYSAQPPLYSAKVGQQTHRAYTETDREVLTRKLQSRGAKNIRWQRFKGLGEMNVDELRYCALNPKTRVLRRITMQDAEQEDAAAEMFNVLMGSDVSSRKEYLIGNSTFINTEVLDV